MEVQAPETELLLNEHDLAKLLRMSPNTLRVWRWKKFGPQWIKVGDLVRYRHEDVERWLDEQPMGGGAPTEGR